MMKSLVKTDEYSIIKIKRYVPDQIHFEYRCNVCKQTIISPGMPVKAGRIVCPLCERVQEDADKKQ